MDTLLAVTGLVGVDGGVQHQRCNVIISDIICSHGVIHVIDAVLVPPGGHSWTPPWPTAASPPWWRPQATGLDDALKGPAPSPSSPPPIRLRRAARRGCWPASPPTATNILLFTWLRQSAAADVLGSRWGVRDTCSPSAGAVGVDGGVTINDANVIITDIICSNGVIPVIDAVLVREAEA